jgi:general secretion pathway protein C
MIALKKYLWVVHLFVIAICSFFVAQMLTTYVSVLLEGSSQAISSAPSQAAEAEESMSAQESYQVIVERNIFNSEESSQEGPPPDDEEVAVGTLDGPAVKTSLDIKVLGIAVVDGGKDRRSSATVSGGKARQPEVFFVGDLESFADGVKFVQAKRESIEFINKGRLEFAMLDGVTDELTIFNDASKVHGDADISQLSGKSSGQDEPQGSQENNALKQEGNKTIIDQKEVDEALERMDQLYTEIRIVPNIKGGKASGMKVLAVKPGSIFSRLGLQRGDILEKINGVELTIEQSMALFSKLKSQKSFRIDLVRKGKNKTLEYEIR